MATSSAPIKEEVPTEATENEMRIPTHFAVKTEHHSASAISTNQSASPNAQVMTSPAVAAQPPSAPLRSTNVAAVAANRSNSLHSTFADTGREQRGPDDQFQKLFKLMRVAELSVVVLCAQKMVALQHSTQYSALVTELIRKVTLTMSTDERNRVLTSLLSPTPTDALDQSLSRRGDFTSDGVPVGSGGGRNAQPFGISSSATGNGGGGGRNGPANMFRESSSSAIEGSTGYDGGGGGSGRNVPANMHTLSSSSAATRNGGGGGAPNYDDLIIIEETSATNRRKISTALVHPVAHTSTSQKRPRIETSSSERSSTVQCSGCSARDGHISHRKVEASSTAGGLRDTTNRQSGSPPGLRVTLNDDMKRRCVFSPPSNDRSETHRRSGIPSPYRCDECSFVFAELNEMQDHKRTKHGSRAHRSDQIASSGRGNGMHTSRERGSNQSRVVGDRYRGRRDGVDGAAQQGNDACRGKFFRRNIDNCNDLEISGSSGSSIEASGEQPRCFDCYQLMEENHICY